MTTVRHDVHHDIAVQIRQHDTPIVSRTLPFVYDADQPYEVAVLVAGHGGTLARLTIPRADLDSGRYKHINRPGSQIATYPNVTDRRWMHIAVRADCGRTATLTVAVADISTFLDPTYDLVPAGREPDYLRVPDGAEFDAWLRRLPGAA